MEMWRGVLDIKRNLRVEMLLCLMSDKTFAVLTLKTQK